VNLPRPLISVPRNLEPPDGQANIRSDGLLAFSQSPIIALYADLTTAVPVYISGGLILFAGALALVLPFEPRGKASL